MKILIFGANGMLGNTLFRYFRDRGYEVVGTVRNHAWTEGILEGFSLNQEEKISQLLESFKPDFVLNCVGVIKQVKEAKDSELNISCNALWPHTLARLCLGSNSRLIHFSTDCVFTGNDGMYTEESFCDSRDIYGLSKLMGEVDYPHALTLRTSIIGHELNSHLSLVDWFLSQEGSCNGYDQAIYSGFPTVSIGRIIEKFVFPKMINEGKCGLYHLSSEPIDKFSLLNMIASEYGKNIEIKPCSKLKIDRSLDSKRFREEFGFKPDSWLDLIRDMHTDYKLLKKEGLR